MWGKFLNWIARAYFSFYCHLLQRPPEQPITRQADRMERRWPTFTWGFALLVFGLTAQLRGWALCLTAAVYLFALWFIPHITSYQRAHPENQPYYKTNKLLAWAIKRMG